MSRWFGVMLALLVLAVPPAAAQPAAAGPDEARPFTAAIAHAQRRTVKVLGAQIGRSAGYASGVVVGPAGQIVTASGAFLSGEQLRVTLADGSSHAASVVRRSEPLQLALLQIDASTPEYFDLSRQPPAVRPGDWILVVSNPFRVAERAEPLSVHLGILSARLPLDARRGVHDAPYAAEAWLYDAVTSNPGAEGGAVVAADGQLVGLVGRILESNTTGTRLNYAVPVNRVASFVAGQESPLPAVTARSGHAEQADRPVPADLGLRLFALGGRRGPAYIDRVVPGGPAARAGLRADDLIVAINGQPVRSSEDFRLLAAALPVGQPAVIEVKRKNEVLVLQIVPEAQK